MSCIIVASFQGRAVLAADSRTCSQDGRVVSDSEGKITEIAPGVFLAVSGYTHVCDWQRKRFADAAGGSEDIRQIVAALDGALADPLRRLVQDLSEAGAIDPLVRKPLHGYVVVGRAAGVPSWVARYFYAEGGRIFDQIIAPVEGPVPAAWFTTPVPMYGDLLAAGVWADGLAAGVERIFAAITRVNPFAGGFLQVVEISDQGSRWLHRLPVPSEVSIREDDTLRVNDISGWDGSAIQVLANGFGITGTSGTVWIGGSSQYAISAVGQAVHFGSMTVDGGVNVGSLYLHGALYPATGYTAIDDSFSYMKPDGSTGVLQFKNGVLTSRI